MKRRGFDAVVISLEEGMSDGTREGAGHPG